MDIRTLFLAAMVVWSLSTCSLIIVWRTQKTYPGFEYWVLFSSGITAGYISLSLHGMLPPFIPILIGNGFLLISVLWALKGFRVFFGKDRLHLGYWITLALVESGLVWFTYVTPNISVRVLLVALFLGIISIIIARELIFNAPVALRGASRFIGAVVIGHGIFLIARGVATVLWAPLSSFFSPNSIQAATYLITMVVSIISAFGFIMLNSQRVEEEVRRSERQFRSLFETTQDSIFIVDKEARNIINANPAACELYGYSKDEFLRMKHIDICADQEATSIVVRDSVKNVPLCLHRKKDGTVFPVEIAGGYFTDSGREVHTVFVRDVTERTQAEKKVQESERRYRLLVDNTEFPVVVTSLYDGRCLFINERASAFFGVTVAEAFRENARDYWVRPEDRDHFIADLLKNKRLYSYECELITKEGVRRWVLVSASIIEYEAEPAAFLVYNDITGRKLMEDALRESEERLRAVFDSAKDFIFIKDRNRRYTLVNSFFEKRFRVDRSVFIGNKDDEIPIFENKEITGKVVNDTDGKVLRGETVEYQLTHRISGTGITLDIIKTPIRDEKGIVAGICGLARDVTDRLKTAEERKSLEERLQRAEKMESLGVLAGGVAHDLNNVLGVVIGYSELLLRRVDESNPARPYIKNILKGGGRAAAIVQDLLTLARRGVPTREVLNLNAVIDEYQKSPEFMNLITYHPFVHIRIRLEPNLLNVSGSFVQLGKTLFNLVSNAAEAMPKGGVVTIETRNQYLDMPIQGYDEVKEGDYVVLSISDTGEGISSADMKRIFEPFYTKKVMGRSGTGLGLAVVWGTVKDHEGYINVQSERAKGSTFTLYFPVTREEIRGETIHISISEYMGNGESILVVDDVKEQRDIATEMLKDLNYSVESVSSGAEAVKYLKNNRVDLVVLDMIMDPGIDGLDTYKRIVEICPGQKAIIVSGFSETERVSQAQVLGAGAYVKKPYVLESLGLAVRKELGK